MSTPTTSEPAHSKLSALASGGAGVAVAMGVMNVGAYGFTLVSARLLGPQSYGAVASLMATLLIVMVLQLGIQATAARRIAADPDHTAQIAHGILKVTYRAAFAFGIVMLLAAPLINALLHLESLSTAALVAATAVPLTITGGQLGILQGERRWSPVAWMYVASGVPRLLFGVLLTMWRPTEFMAMLGVFLGACVPVLIGWFALKDERPEGALSADHGARSLLSETVRNSQTLLAFFALINVDIVVARNVLDLHDAGLYAAGLILAKAVLFLPQFVVVVSFPAMSTARERRTALARGLALVAVLGAACVGGTLVLPRLALAFAGGPAYLEIEPYIWLFALLGTAMSMLQLLVYAVLARRGKRSAWALWMAFVIVLLAGRLATSPLELLVTVVVCESSVLMLLFAVSLYLIRKPVVDDGIDAPIGA
ncbi:MAG: oligosaccharide flippase family protein [Marmoricola sp.]